MKRAFSKSAIAWSLIICIRESVKKQQWKPGNWKRVFLFCTTKLSVFIQRNPLWRICLSNTPGGSFRFWGVSSAAIFPPDRKATRSHSRSASVILWVVKNTVVPFLRSSSMILQIHREEADLMLKGFFHLLKKDFRLMVSGKFFLLALASLLLYSCYINFVYVNRRTKIRQ